jgi:two-component system, chemotaxis family, protein-glutamate methylesterase/glutaminase
MPWKSVNCTWRLPDGAEGLLQMKKAGARTIAQDELSSVVWGMPKAAVKIGAAEEILHLNKIHQKIIMWAQGKF